MLDLDNLDAQLSPYILQQQSARQNWMKLKFRLLLLSKFSNYRQLSTPAVEVGSEDEKSDQRHKAAAYIIDSDSPYKLLWNMFTNTFYMLSFFMYPLILSFQFKSFEDLRFFELFLDFIMLCDIATEFVTTRN